MKKPAQLFAILLLLQFLAPAQIVVLAQKPKATRSKATESGRYAKQLALFEEFVGKQMVLDRTVGLTIGFMKDDFELAKAFAYFNQYVIRAC